MCTSHNKIQKTFNVRKQCDGTLNRIVECESRIVCVLCDIKFFFSYFFFLLFGSFVSFVHVPVLCHGFGVEQCTRFVVRGLCLTISNRRVVSLFAVNVRQLYIRNQKNKSPKNEIFLFSQWKWENGFLKINFLLQSQSVSALWTQNGCVRTIKIFLDEANERVKSCLFSNNLKTNDAL